MPMTSGGPSAYTSHSSLHQPHHHHRELKIQLMNTNTNTNANMITTLIAPSHQTRSTTPSFRHITITLPSRASAHCSLTAHDAISTPALFSSTATKTSKLQVIVYSLNLPTKRQNKNILIAQTKSKLRLNTHHLPCLFPQPLTAPPTPYQNKTPAPQPASSPTPQPQNHSTSCTGTHRDIRPIPL